jgi:hypothetical protein
MKLFSTLICTSVVTIFLLSCNKDGKDKLTPSDLAGEWELEQTSSDVPTKTFPPGSGNLVKFTKTNYQFYTNGSLVKSGQYILVSDTTVAQNTCQEIEPGKFTRRIVYDNNYDSQKAFIDIIDGKLNFTGGCFSTDGGFLSIYRRL